MTILAPAQTGRIAIKPQKSKKSVSVGVVADLAARLASYRLDGCPPGAARAIIADCKKVARRARRSYSELWALVHCDAYAIIDADPRSAL